MNCNWIKKQLSAYQDGELGGHELDTVVAHIESCDSCRECLIELQRSWDLLEAIPGADPNPFFYTTLKGRLNTAKPKRRWRFSLVIPVAAAAVIVLGIWMGSAVTRNGNGPGYQTDLAGDTAIPALDQIELLENYPPESIGEVYTELATLR